MRPAADAAARGSLPLAVSIAAALGLLIPIAAPAAAAEPVPEPYRLEAGAYVRDRVVVLGRDFLLAGEAYDDAVVLDGDARVSGRVGGDLIVLGGDARLEPGARIAGDVFVVGGVVEAGAGVQVGGRSVAYPDASSAWLTLVEGPVMGLSAFSPVILGAKLALLAFWAFLLLALFQIGGREVLATSESVRDEPFRNFFVGMTGVFAMVLTALFFSAFAGAFLGLPLLVLVAIVALALRFWGMVAVFHAVGAWICTSLRLRRRPPLTLACYGLLALGLLKLLPYVGIWTWTVATFIGVGASLTTKLGRREPWLQPLPAR